MAQRLRLVHAVASVVAVAAAVSPATGGRKSSAVTSPPVASLMRAATSRPGHEGSSEQSSVTYAGETPIAAAKAERVILAVESQSPSFDIAGEYSAKLKFSQDKKLSQPIWSAPQRGKTLTAMAKQARAEPKVRTRFKAEKPGHFIRQWRKHRNMTQERLAGLVEMSAPTISQLENGNQGYTQSTLERLADALSCRPGDLLMRDPTRDDAPYSILDSLKPETRRQAMVLLRALADADKADRAA